MKEDYEKFGIILDSYNSKFEEIFQDITKKENNQYIKNFLDFYLKLYINGFSERNRIIFYNQKVKIIFIKILFHI